MKTDAEMVPEAHLSAATGAEARRKQPNGSVTRLLKRMYR